MDPVKKLTKLFFDHDPMKLKSSWEGEYASEAATIVKEMQYIRTQEKLSLLLYTLFAKEFSASDAQISWKPIAEAILKDDDLRKLLGRLS